MPCVAIESSRARLMRLSCKRTARSALLRVGSFGATGPLREGAGLKPRRYKGIGSEEETRVQKRTRAEGVRNFRVRVSVVAGVVEPLETLNSRNVLRVRRRSGR